MLLLQVKTQWRTSFNGVIGLDYGPAFRLMDQQGLQGKDWDDMFSDLQVMESAALKAMSNRG